MLTVINTELPIVIQEGGKITVALESPVDIKDLEIKIETPLNSDVTLTVKFV